MVLACCLYCRAEFAVKKEGQTGRGRKWHDCPQALAVRKKLERAMARQWEKEHPGHKKSRDNYKAKIHCTDRKNGQHRARCGHVSPNIFNCAHCLANKSSPGHVMGYPLGSW